MKLLLIDDDTIDRMNIIRTLKKSGHSVECVETASPTEGVGLAQSQPFDLILLDYHLPEMNGLEVLESLRQNQDHKAAVIILSHNTDDNLTIKCIEAGAQDYVKKSDLTSCRLMQAILHSRERYKIEQKLRNKQEELRKLAEVDPLTGLANRHMFDEALKTAIPLAKRQGKSVALIILDLDKFKHVNDTLGHVAGDALLKEVAARLKKTTRDEDHLCRMGGDEFAILIQNLENPSKVRMVAHRIIEEFATPFRLEERNYFVSASIGIATLQDCAFDAEQLMKCADIAMYRSKEAGRNQTSFYSQTIHDEFLKQVRLERDLHSAIENDEFTLYYQPQVRYTDHQITSAEVLIRWQHPTRGLIPPNDFIPIAEEVGLIKLLGRWVIQTACMQFSKWRKQFKPKDLPFSLSINLSAHQLDQPNFFYFVKNTLEQNQIPPNKIILELTETAITRDLEVGSLLRNLSDLGIRLALDDFGTGYSSLSQLQKFPFSILKIDKSFVQAISSEHNDANFLKAINSFAKALGFEIIAEGVETKEQLKWCEHLELNLIQGYFFAKPMPVREFEQQWLKKIADGQMTTSGSCN